MKKEQINKQVKVAMYGCGKMSQYLMRYVIEKNGAIVSAFDINPEIIGKDISEIIGHDFKKTKVIVKDANELEKEFKKERPDICLVATMSLLKDNQILVKLAELGINAITTCEEAFFPWNSNPFLAYDIDGKAVESGCTICASGYQDVFWANLIDILAGSSQSIKMIEGKSSYNVEDYGIALAQAHGVGLTLKEFDEQIAIVDKISDEKRKELIKKGDFLPSYMWNVNGWLCSRLNLKVKKQDQKCVPEICEEDMFSSTLKMTIKKGLVKGMRAIVTTETSEGVTIISECIGKVYTKDEFDSNEWTVKGEPNTTIVVNRPSTVELTCASVVNRINDVINAQEGFITTDYLPPICFQPELFIIDEDGCSCGCEEVVEESCDDFTTEQIIPKSINETKETNETKKSTEVKEKNETKASEKHVCTCEKCQGKK